jgi:hypothetical protein
LGALTLTLTLTLALALALALAPNLRDGDRGDHLVDEGLRMG